MKIMRYVAHFILLALLVSTARAEEFITVASTTSVAGSGLFGYLLPIFEAKNGIEVRVVAQGTGQALETGRRGDADVVFVHASEAEKKFVAEGSGVERFVVMYNDFVLVGPKEDPASIKLARTAAEAFANIANTKSMFASRGDDSGTHVAELAIWKAIDVQPSGSWYLATGSGMGATLNIAAQMPAYALTDRGTWLSFKNRGPLDILYEGDPGMFNPYGVILVNPERHPHVKAEAGQKFIEWLISAEGQAAINGYEVNGQQLFFGNAHE